MWQMALFSKSSGYRATNSSACRDCILTDCIYQISLFAVWFYFYVGKVFISCFAKKRTKEGDLRGHYEKA